MVSFRVTAEELRDAARRIEAQTQAYRDAATHAQDAGQTLASQWEGNAKETFVTEQQEANNWFQKMAGFLDAYADALKKAAHAYESADQEAANLIKRK